MIEPLIHSMIVCPDVDRVYPKAKYGQGNYVIDEHEKRYLDAASGSAAVTNLGYSQPEIVDVIAEQSSKIPVLPTHAFHSSILENYLSKIVDFSPEGFTRAWTVMSGTEAVENSIKLALQYHQLRGKPKKHKLISRWNTYHGNSVFTLDIGGMKSRRSLYNYWLHNFPHIPSASSYRRPVEMTDQEYSKFCAESLENCIIETGPDSVAAFIVEPVVAAAMGAVPPPDDQYFRRIREVCDKYDVLLIADEVLTGFGRTGENFGLNNWGVKPDIIAAGKGISAGFYPLSAVIAQDHITQVLIEKKQPFLGGHTFACNPVGAAVGLKVLDIITRDCMIEESKRKGAILKAKLKDLLDIPVVGDVRGVGMMLGVELVKDQLTKEPFSPDLKFSKRVGLESLERGLIVYPGQGTVDGVKGDHIMITPPLTLQDEEIDLVVSRLAQSIKRVFEQESNSTVGVV